MVKCRICGTDLILRKSSVYYCEKCRTYQKKEEVLGIHSNEEI